MFGYGLNRFSEDLDFDIARSFSGSGTIKLDNLLKKSMPPGVECTNLMLKKDTPTVTRYMLHYHDPKNNLAGQLKIEISYRQPAHELDVMRKDGMSFLSAEKIAEFKIGAVVDDTHQEQRTKARDLFDASFLVKQHSELIKVASLEKLSQLDLDTTISRYQSAFEADPILKLNNISADDVVLALMENTEAALERTNEKTRVVVGSKHMCLECQNSAGNWEAKMSNDTPDGMKPGIYLLHTAKAAEEGKTYEGVVVYKKGDALFQQTKIGIVRHQANKFAENVAIGKNCTIKTENGQMMASHNTTTKRKQITQ